MTKLKLCAALVSIPAVGCVADDPAPELTTAVSSAPATQLAGTPHTWRKMATPIPFSAAGAPHQLNDGRIVVQEYFTNNWWALTPDNTGSYSNGSWEQLASTPVMATGEDPYSPLYYGSGTLPDGRLVVEGGEYDGSNNPGFSLHGAIYDPAKDKWTPIAPPSGWTLIGDASAMVMPDGRFLLSNCCDNGSSRGAHHAPLAYLHPDNLTWEAIPTAETTKQSTSNDEESWALLPDDTILAIDADNRAKPTESEVFDPATGKWSSAGSTVVAIADNQGGSPSLEEGPIMLRHDGVAFGIGTTMNTASYDTKTQKWTAGPTMPKNSSQVQLGSKDGPGAVLPDGTMFVALSPAPLGNETFPAGVLFFEFDGTKFTAAPATTNAASLGSFQVNFIILPTGELMQTDQTSDIEIYTPAPGTFPGANPTLTSAPRLVTSDDPDPIIPDVAVKDDHTVDPETGVSRALLPLTTLHPGRTYKVGGTQLAGLTQGAYYGDDQQSPTNRPIMRVTSMATGHVKYLNAHHTSSYSVTPGKKSTTFFDVPADTEAGVAILETVATGIASPPVVVNIK